MTMHAVRKQILQILKEEGDATVAELAKALEMAPVSVRHHLDLLQGDNLIAVDRVRRKGSVGRPQQVYGLTPEANEYFPDNFAGLAGKLVLQMKEYLPAEQVDQAFAAIARQIAEELPVDELPDAELSTRLAAVADFLNERGYLSRWEQVVGENGGAYFLLHKHNCPYASVSQEHSEICCMDQKLVDELVGVHCERVQSMRDEERCCTYRVAAESAANASIAPIELVFTS
ncbi:MAG: helix-turn-helix domain-containing protein [Caldilineaceae bacterium]|nr:helix-turn-helix domain-containing protein [Caldilineaceae bacterium]